MPAALDHLRAELGEGIGTFLKTWLMAFVLLMALVTLRGVIVAPWGGSFEDVAFLVIAHVIIGIGYGAVLGVFVGAAALAWRLFGLATLVTIGVFPLVLWATFSLGSGWLDSAWTELVSEAVRAGSAAAGATGESIGAMPAARIGGPAGAIILLFLLLWAIPVFLGNFVASVWIAAVYMLVGVFVLAALGLLLAIVISTPVLLGALIIRMRRRADARNV